MPEEILILSVISIIVVSGVLISIAKMWFNYLNGRAGVKKEKSSSSSLTTSELEAMLRRVSEDANAPLLERIERLEGKLGKTEKTKQLPEHRQSLLDELDEAQELAAATQRRKSESTK